MISEWRAGFRTPLAFSRPPAVLNWTEKPSQEAIEKLQEAVRTRDADFFYEIARGLEALKKKEQALLDDPRYHLACAYDLLYDQHDAPTKKELVEMAQRHWALKIVTNNSPFVIPTQR